MLVIIKPVVYIEINNVVMAWFSSNAFVETLSRGKLELGRPGDKGSCKFHR